MLRPPSRLKLVMPAILLLVTQLGGCGFMSGDAAAESIELVEDNQTPADALPLGGPTTVDRPKLTSVPIPTLASRNPPDTTTGSINAANASSTSAAGDESTNRCHYPCPYPRDSAHSCNPDQRISTDNSSAS